MPPATPPAIAPMGGDERKSSAGLEPPTEGVLEAGSEVVGADAGVGTDSRGDEETGSASSTVYIMLSNRRMDALDPLARTSML